ncbi:hypothetical protein D9M73_165320 [compost metagenome]
MTEPGAGQGIDFAGGREAQQVPEADQVQMGVGMLRGRVAKVGREPVHACGADVFPAGVRQQNPAAQLLKGFGDGPGRFVGTDDEKPAGCRFGDLEQACQRPGRGALQYHRANDYREGQRYQQQGILVAGLVQTDGKNSGNGRSNDAAWRNPGQQRALPPVE